MNGMFALASSFNQNLNAWNMENVSDLGAMFAYATSFNTPLDKWNLKSAKHISWLFKGAKNFNQNLESWAKTFSHCENCDSNSWQSTQNLNIESKGMFEESSIKSPPKWYK